MTLELGAVRGRVGSAVEEVVIPDYNTNQDDRVLVTVPVPAGVEVQFAFYGQQEGPAGNAWNEVPSIKFSDGNEIRVYQGVGGHLGYVGRTVGPISVSSFWRGRRQDIWIRSIRLYWWKV